MQYCGGKFYQAKGISEVLNRYIAAGSGVYWEPFIGMASVAMRPYNPLSRNSEIPTSAQQSATEP